MKKRMTMLIAVAAVLLFSAGGAMAVPSSYEAVVWEGHSFTTPYVTLGATYSFDYWFVMTVPPPEYNGQAFDALSVNENGTYAYISGVYAWNTSEDWVHATLNVPVSLQGKYTKILFQVNDFGPDTDPYVYLNNVPGAAAVPEPATMLLMGFGLAGVAAAGRKLRK